MEGIDGRRKILILSHSRTGGAARLARHAGRTLSEMGCQVSILPVEPLFRLPYLLWLLLSFIPGMRFPIKTIGTNFSAFDSLIIAFPKWSAANPVFNSLAASLNKSTPPTTLLVSYGGWRGEGFLRRAVKAVQKRGVKVSGAILVKRRSAGENEREVGSFVEEVFSGSNYRDLA